MKWNDNNTITVDPPKKPKKITGTRFAAILGLNPWKTPFEAWCEITRTYEEPFQDNKFTIAGKTIEPKQAEYVRKFGLRVDSPTDVYGADYFQKTHGDFFPEHDVFGGMWDYLLVENNAFTGVLEMKTTKRAEDWEYDIPEYYALQAALYAYLLGVDNVYMVCSILQESDYDHPENYVPNSSNTIIRSFNVSEKYPLLNTMICAADVFWTEHVMAGLSPEYDEKADADILKELRKNNVNPDTDIKALIDEAEGLQAEIDDINKSISEKEKRLKVLKDMIKDYSIKCFREGDKQVEFKGGRYIWTVSKTPTTSIDKDAMKKDGVLDKYTKKSETLKLTNKEVTDVH